MWLVVSAMLVTIYIIVSIRLWTVCLCEHFDTNDPRLLHNVFVIRSYNKLTTILLKHKKKILLLRYIQHCTSGKLSPTTYSYGNQYSWNVCNKYVYWKCIRFSSYIYSSCILYKIWKLDANPLLRFLIFDKKVIPDRRRQFYLF